MFLPFTLYEVAALTWAVAVALPVELAAVNVKVVAEETNTFIDPLSAGDTVPTLGAIDNAVASFTFQLSLTESPPTGTDAGSAVKETMVGLVGCV